MGDISNIRVEPSNISWSGNDLGLLDGDIELKPEEMSVDITAHQFGSNVLDAIRTGKKLEITTALKETSIAQITRILNGQGATAVAAAAVQTVTCIADVAKSLQNKYFFIYSALDAVYYYVWFNVNSEGVAPAPSGYTGVEIALATGASASTVATAVAAALDALAGFVSSASGAVVTVTNAATGGCTAAVDNNSTFTFAVTTYGISAVPGWGTSKDFTGQLASAGKLVIHPVVLASTDLSRDITIWKAYPMLDSLTKSAENPLMMALTWKIFPDLNRAATSRYFIFGEGRG
jgi:hypothetical protein